MNRIERTLRGWLGVLLLAGTLAVPAAASAQAADVINVQGRLLSQAGTAVPDGTYGMTVSFYKTEKDAKAIYTYVTSGIAVKNGVFHLAVGDKTPLNKQVFVSQEAAWVGIQVGNDAELPRLPMYKVPYALSADSAKTVACTGCIGKSHLSSTFEATLAKKADLKDFAKTADLSAAAKSGAYKDLTGKPKLVAVDQVCPKGETVTGIGTDGKVACAKDAVNTYTGKDFGVSNQKCASGSVMAGLDADGKAVCVKDQKGNVSGADFATSDQDCGAGFAARGIDKSGKLVCAKDKDTDTKYNGSNFALSNQSCGTGLVLKGINSLGKAVCVKDANNTYSKANFVPSNQKCPSNRVVAGFTSTGVPICVLDQKGQSSGKDFALSNQKCASGQVVAGVDVAGKVVCEIKGQVKGTPYALSNQACPTGYFVKNISSTGKVVCVKDANSTYSGKNFALANKKCSSTQLQIGTSSTGNPLCINNSALNMDWKYGWSNRAAASGKWLSSLGWGLPAFALKNCAYTDASGLNTSNTANVEFNIPSGAKSAYVSFLAWKDSGYFDIYARYGSTWKFKRRINAWQGVQNASTSGTHDGNTIMLAATGLTGYNRVRIQGRKGRIHFTGIGFSRNDNSGNSGTGFAHWDNILNKPAMAANAFSTTQVNNLKAAKLANGTTPWTDGKKHNHTYNVNDTWLRENGDNAHFRVYGNKRTIVMRTDGVGQYNNNGSYPFIWNYGGDSSTYRKMILHSTGEIWTSKYGWLHTKFAPATGSSAYVKRGGDTMTGALKFASTSLYQGGTGLLRATYGSGYVEMGAANTSYGYIQTNRPSFYFNKGLRVDTGRISSYNESLYLGVSGSTKLTLTSKGWAGFNDTSPDYPIDVETSHTSWQAHFNNGGDRVYFAHGGGYGMHIATAAKDSTTPYLMYVGNASGEALRVRGDRKVGIRTSAPAAVLDVNGNTYLRSNVGIATKPRTDSYRLSMGGNIHMNNKQLNHVDQVHFNANVRFYDEGNDNYLNFKYGDSGGGGIKVIDGNGTLQGYLYADGSTTSSFGLLDADGHWAVRVHEDNAVEFRVNNGVEATVKSDGLYVSNKIVSAGNQVQRDFYQYASTTTGARYLHMKTNIRMTTSSIMYNIAFRGYNYGRNVIINSQVAGYAYASTKTINKATYANYSSGISASGRATNGTSAAGQYRSGDGYLVIRVYASNWYYAGFSMSAWMTSPAGKGYQVRVTATSLSTSSAKRY